MPQRATERTRRRERAKASGPPRARNAARTRRGSARGSRGARGRERRDEVDGLGVGRQRADGVAPSRRIEETRPATVMTLPRAASGSLDRGDARHARPCRRGSTGRRSSRLPRRCRRPAGRASCRPCPPSPPRRPSVRTRCRSGCRARGLGSRPEQARRWTCRRTSASRARTGRPELLASSLRSAGVIAAYRASCSAVSALRLAAAAASRMVATLRPYQASGPTSTSPVEPSARSYPRSIQPSSRSTAPSCRPSRFAYSARTEVLPSVRDERAHLERRRGDPHLARPHRGRASGRCWRPRPERPVFCETSAVAGLASFAVTWTFASKRTPPCVPRVASLSAPLAHQASSGARPSPCRRESSRGCSPTGRSTPPRPPCVGLSRSTRDPRRAPSSLTRARSPRSTISPSPCIDPEPSSTSACSFARPRPSSMARPLGSGSQLVQAARGGPGRRAGGRSRRARPRRTGRA